MLLQSNTLAQHPQLRQLAQCLQERAQKLLWAGKKLGESWSKCSCWASLNGSWLSAGRSEPWGATGRLPKPGQYCCEALQVAVYQEGQYFMAHEVCMPDMCVPDHHV